MGSMTSQRSCQNQNLAHYSDRASAGCSPHGYPASFGGDVSLPDVLAESGLHALAACLISPEHAVIVGDIAVQTRLRILRVQVVAALP